jgi:lysophospholipase L1-like esterase
MNRFRLILAAALMLREPCNAANSYQFDFGAGKIAEGYAQVLPTMIYSDERGFGFEPGARVQSVERDGNDVFRGDFVTSDEPFLFSAALPEGNYNVTITFGDAAGASTNAIKAESRRLMLEEVRTATGKFETRSFTVNVRTPKISTGGAVRLKDREKPYLHWDHKLTLEFNGARPCVAALEISPARNTITVYLAGDSTVTDQPTEPWNSWGQMLPRFFKPGVAIANHAESGESFKSSIGARRFEKIFSTIQHGDYLFMQFGHNDMKDRAPDALASYQSSLERFIGEARLRGATPVLLTSMERMAGVERDTLGGYPDTVRAVAKEKNVALIDLHAMSKVLYRALGTDLGKAFQDGTHHNNYGSYELARCVVEGIRQNNLSLVQFIADDVAVFDPAKPDLVERFNVPASPQRNAAKPDGN